MRAAGCVCVMQNDYAVPWNIDHIVPQRNKPFSSMTTEKEGAARCLSDTGTDFSFYWLLAEYVMTGLMFVDCLCAVAWRGGFPFYDGIPHRNVFFRARGIWLVDSIWLLLLW